MKIYLSILLLSFSQLLFAQADTTKIESDIESVTVYFQGARISRKAKANLKPGKQTVVLAGLTAQLNPDRIEVKAGEGLTILSVNHRLVQPDNKPNDKKISALKNQINQLEYRTKKLLNEQNVYDVEEKLLMDNRNFQNNNKGASVAEIREAADFYRKRLNEIRAGKLGLKRAIQAVQDSVLDLNVALNRLSVKNRLTRSEIVLSVEASRAFSDKLTCTYFVDAAGWDPLYDFRVSEITDPLLVNYNANVFQSTGEDWAAVDLTLSSGYPDMSGTAPELQPWYLNRIPSPPSRKSPRGQGAISGQVTDASNGDPLPYANITLTANGMQPRGTSTDVNGRYSIKPVPSGSYTIQAGFVGYQSSPASQVFISPNQNRNFNIALRRSDVKIEEIQMSGVPRNKAARVADEYEIREDAETESIYFNLNNSPEPTMQLTPNQVSYTIPTPYTIPSNGHDYLIAIKKDQISADYIYQTIPKYDTDVYLIARIPDWSRLNLLSGNSSIYYQGAYTGDAFVDANSTKDTLELSLGRDRNITVSREGNKELNDKRIFGNTVRETVGWELTVRNNKPVPIAIELLDQFPLSEVKSIEVDRGEYGNATLDDKSGKLTWELNIPAGSSQKVEFDYKVKYPVDMRIYK